jgi:hypothetical protein
MQRNFMNSPFFSFKSSSIAQAVILVTIMGLASSASAVGQDLTEVITPPDEKGKNNLQEVQVQRSVKPAFLIEPLVQRLQGRKGQLIKFEFKIEANERRSRLDIRPVAMTQQETGVIMPDDKAPAPDVLRITSASSVDLTVGGEHIIQGEMRIPITDAPFLSYGILAREMPIDGENNEDVDGARVGVRFVTQYLLRVDVDVLGNRGDSLSELKLTDGALVPKEGRCLGRVFIENPTDTAMEFAVDCQLMRTDSQSVGKKFGLVVPVRSSQSGPERYKARLLAKCKIRMEELLPHPIFPGSYTLTATLSHQGKLIHKLEFPVQCRDGDFPAQDARVVRVAQDITVEPANVELSIRKGGRRFESIAVQNSSLQKVKIQLTTEKLQGDLDASLRLKPSEFELPAGQTRKVSVSMDAVRTHTEHAYASIVLTASPEIGEAIGSQRIPVALLTNSESLAQLVPSEPQWSSSNDHAGFKMTVRNDGLRHVALQGRLTLADEFGRGLATDAGYGQWLLPGQTSEMFFGFAEPPPAGNYAIEVILNQSEGQSPLVLQKSIRLQNPLEEPVPPNPADPKVSGEPPVRK